MVAPGRELGNPVVLTAAGGCHRRHIRHAHDDADHERDGAQVTPDKATSTALSQAESRRAEASVSKMLLNRPSRLMLTRVNLPGGNQRAGEA